MGTTSSTSRKSPKAQIVPVTTPVQEFKSSPEPLTVVTASAGESTVLGSAPSFRIAGMNLRMDSATMEHENSLDAALKALDDMQSAFESEKWSETPPREMLSYIEDIRLVLANKSVATALQTDDKKKNVEDQYRSMRAQPEFAAFVEAEFGLDQVLEIPRTRRRTISLGHAARMVLLTRKLGVASNTPADLRMVVRSCGVTDPESVTTLQRMYSNLADWRFDVFALHQGTKGHALRSVCLMSFISNGLIADLNIPKPVVLDWVVMIEEGYIASNPYHNAIHGADVAQGVHAFIKGGLAQELELRPVETFALVVGAVIHDFKHPGVNNNFLINTSDSLAVLYNDKAVLENMHVAEAFRLSTGSCGLFDSLTPPQRKASRSLIIETVLSTDMTGHFAKLNGFQAVMEKPSTSRTDKDRLLVLCMALHTADVSNPVRSTKVYERWASRVMCEFFAQGESEAEKGLDVSPMMSREATDPVKCQMGFINFIVAPTFKAWGRAVPGMRETFDDCLKANLAWLENDAVIDVPMSAGVFDNLPSSGSISPHLAREDTTGSGPKGSLLDPTFRRSITTDTAQ